jgi:hypothetical protein
MSNNNQYDPNKPKQPVTQPAPDTSKVDPKTQKIGDKSGYAQTDDDIQNNPDGPKPLAPNDPEPISETAAAKQARHARENEKASGEGKTEPWPHD